MLSVIVPNNDKRITDIYMIKKLTQAEAELCQAQLSLKLANLTVRN